MRRKCYAKKLLNFAAQIALESLKCKKSPAIILNTANFYMAPNTTENHRRLSVFDEERYNALGNLVRAADDVLVVLRADMVNVATAI